MCSYYYNRYVGHYPLVNRTDYSMRLSSQGPCNKRQVQRSNPGSIFFSCSLHDLSYLILVFVMRPFGGNPELAH
ncbi:hypothetical protein Hanom_Chr00s000008g01616091 [Helianthus anomalus]